MSTPNNLAFNVSRLQGAAPFNVIPDHGLLEFSVRPRSDVFMAKLKEFCRNTACRINPAIQLQVLLEQPAFECREIGQFSKWFDDKCKQAIELPYWTEAALFATVGLNTAVYGPGSIADAHQPNESIAIGAFAQAVHQFVRILGDPI
jgi:acetylornithine deacetylase